MVYSSLGDQIRSRITGFWQGSAVTRVGSQPSDGNRRPSCSHCRQIRIC
jgi:hypothetical protein